MSSTRQNPAEQAKALASQLKCPMGDTGQELAHSLNLGNLPMIVSALNALGIEEGDRILEVGPGNGGLLNYVLSIAENLHYDGVEISPLMYEQARAANNVFIAEGLAEYALYDGVNLPYEDGVFTKVLSVNTVYFWEEPAWLLAEMCRVLTAGGRVCLSFCEKDFMKTLPFTKYGFALYDAADIVALTQELPLHTVAVQHLHDMAVPGGSARLVRRDYVNLVLEKEH